MGADDRMCKWQWPPRKAYGSKWVWCFLALSSGPVWTPTDSVTVRTPPNIPGTIEAQAKFFQDFFSVQLSPYKIEFGHVCEDPNTWEQRYEKKDFKNHRDMGKIRWGDKNGGYGEHYWDLNHAGHTGSHEGDDYDDGSYREDPQDSYKETNSQSNKYDPNDSSQYEDAEQTKRANSKTNIQKRKSELEQISKLIRVRKNAELSEEERIPDTNRKASTNNNQPRPVREQRVADDFQPSDKTDIVLIDYNAEHNLKNTMKVPKQKISARYDNGSGLRQNNDYAIPSSTPISRFFLESSTGHIIDRATRQAYPLQPVPFNNKHN